MTKTHLPKMQRAADKKWFMIDAKDQLLGHLATRIVDILRGKNKTTFTPHLDQGDYVVVINAAQVAVTGKKEEDKEYYRHSGYPGSLRTTTLGQMRKKDPAKIIYDAVAGMMPRNRLKRSMMTKLKIYATDAHDHTAQQPQTITL